LKAWNFKRNSYCVILCLIAISLKYGKNL